jgi:hypothetical protein
MFVWAAEASPPRRQLNSVAATERLRKSREKNFSVV